MVDIPIKQLDILDEFVRRYLTAVHRICTVFFLITVFVTLTMFMPANSSGVGFRHFCDFESKNRCVPEAVTV